MHGGGGGGFVAQVLALIFPQESGRSAGGERSVRPQSARVDVDRTSMQLGSQTKEELGLEVRARCVCVRERGQEKQTTETRRKETLRHKANTDKQKAQKK